MNHPFYRMLFPNTRLAPGGISNLLLATTAGGGCRSVTVGGASTGFGADIILIDDALKAGEIVSQARREELDRFYRGTLLTRLNSPRTGVIISIQQRLGEDDLPARLIEAGAEHLCLPAYDDEERVYEIGFGRIYRRPIGEVLRPRDGPREVLDDLRRTMGPREFDTQYLQRAAALEGNIVRTDAFARFALEDYPRSVFRKVVQSWDTASSEHGDFSVCLTFGYDDGAWFLIDALRDRLSYPQLRDRVIAQKQLWKADVVLIEDAGAGTHLEQDLRHRHDLRPIMLRPQTDKVTRMVGQLAIIDDGDILLPIEAPWLPTLLSELRAFPNGRHDDQVDSLAQFLEWTKRNDKWARIPVDPETGRALYLERKEGRPFH